jgi:mRNA (guanine-N7-)-methyltransferase
VNDALTSFADNARPEVGVEHREYSPIIGLKKFNNWIKSVLIGKFSYRPPGGSGARVLDIGCGKGGDLQKWRQARIQLYVGLGEQIPPVISQSGGFAR